MGNTFTYHLNPDENPYDRSPHEFPPLYGFPEGARKPKGELAFRSFEREVF